MKRILIIEDDSDLRKEVADILRFEGHKVYQADSGKKGLEIAKENLLHLIISDIVMPDMDGFEVLKQWKQKFATKPVPFIFLTALSERCNFRRAMESGADDYLVKPFTAKELIASIHSQLKKYSLIESKIMNKIEQMEGELHRKLDHLKGEIENNRQAESEVAKQNSSLKKQLEEKDVDLMEEVMRLVESRNVLFNLKATMSKKLQQGSATASQKEVLLNLRNRLNNKSLTENNWAVFQLKVNQAFPGFIEKLCRKHPNLTQYELVFVSAIKIGMNTNDIAQLLNISAGSVRKSRYRIKKKFGLSKEDSFLNFLHSITTVMHTVPISEI